MDRLLKYSWVVIVFMLGASFGAFLQERRGYEFVGTHVDGEQVKKAYRVKAPFLKDRDICYATIGPKQVFVICQEYVK